MFDEMGGNEGSVRPAYVELSRWLKEVPPDVLDFRRREAELFFRRLGITFAVYGDPEAQERLIPFDIIPRILVGQSNGNSSSAAWSNGSKPSTPTSRMHTAAAKFSARESCRRIWFSRTRSSVRK